MSQFTITYGTGIWFSLYLIAWFSKQFWKIAIPCLSSGICKNAKKKCKKKRKGGASQQWLNRLTQLTTLLTPFTIFWECHKIKRLRYHIEAFQGDFNAFFPRICRKKGWIQSDLIRIFSLSKNDLRIEYQAELADPLVHALFCWVEIFTGDPSFYQFWCFHISE